MQSQAGGELEPAPLRVPIYVEMPPVVEARPAPLQPAPAPVGEEAGRMGVNKMARYVVEINSETGFGAGWLYDRARGLVVTCQHVAHGEDGAVRPALHVEVAGRALPCALLGSDAARDISVLQVEPAALPAWLEEAKIGESRAGSVYTASSLCSPHLATLLAWLDAASPPWLAGPQAPLERPVYAGGYLAAPAPHSTCSGRLLFKFHGFTAGRGHAGRVLATDAPLEEGYSGGPLVNADGEIIGVNFAFVRRSDVLRGGWAGRWAPSVPQLSLALASEEVVRAVELLARGAHVPDPLFGARLQLSDGTGPPTEAGVMLEEVAGGSCAAGAGLRAGDRVVALGGLPIADEMDFARALYSRAVGERVGVEAVRGGGSPQRLVLEARLHERHGHEPFALW